MQYPPLFWGSIVLSLYVLWKIATYKLLNLDRYEYLNAMSLSEWQEGRVIRLKLQKMYGGHINYGTFYINLRRLGDEGFVESRVQTRKIGRTKYHSRTLFCKIPKGIPYERPQGKLTLAFES